MHDGDIHTRRFTILPRWDPQVCRALAALNGLLQQDTNAFAFQGPLYEIPDSIVPVPEARSFADQKVVPINTKSCATCCTAIAFY